MLKLTLRVKVSSRGRKVDSIFSPIKWVVRLPMLMFTLRNFGPLFFVHTSIYWAEFRWRDEFRYMWTDPWTHWPMMHVWLRVEIGCISMCAILGTVWKPVTEVTFVLKNSFYSPANAIKILCTCRLQSTNYTLKVRSHCTKMEAMLPTNWGIYTVRKRTG